MQILKSKREDDGLAAALVERWTRFVRSLNQQQLTGMLLLFVFFFLVVLHTWSSSRHQYKHDFGAKVGVKATASAKQREDAFASGNAFLLHLVGDAGPKASDLKEAGMKETDKGWRSILQIGTLVKLGDQANATYSVDWGQRHRLRGGYSHSGGGMELSCLQYWKDDEKLYTCDDKTGIIFELRTETHELYPRWILAGGDGNSERPFKCKWMATKDGRLYTGSIGKEWVEHGDIVHNDFQWVKVLPGDKDGRARSVLWENVFKRIREIVKCNPPGYVVHEAVQWSDALEQWVFLPFRVSQEPYDDGDHKGRAGNVIIRCNSSMVQCTWTTVKCSVNPNLGFADFKFLPDGTDTTVVAIRSMLVEDPVAATTTRGTRSQNFLTIFNIDGEVVMDDVPIPGDFKFEGIAIRPRG
ncbi:Apyrase [Diplonema papillatum]|nr:Apyrase [Diplonema papillatum]